MKRVVEVFARDYALVTLVVNIVNIFRTYPNNYLLKVYL